MAKVTLNSGKEEIIKKLGDMRIGEIGVIDSDRWNGNLAICVESITGTLLTVDLSSHDCFSDEDDNLRVRILRSDESITLRND